MMTPEQIRASRQACEAPSDHAENRRERELSRLLASSLDEIESMAVSIATMEETITIVADEVEKMDVAMRGATLGLAALYWDRIRRAVMVMAGRNA